MNKIHVIDLLNKIAKEEEVPKKIHIKQFRSDFIFNGYTYLSDEKEPQNIYWCLHSEALNYEVEIIEEDKNIEEIEKEISKLQSEIDLLSNEIGSYHNKIHSMRDRTNYMKETLKDLQKVVNTLRKGE